LRCLLLATRYIITKDRDIFLDDDDLVDEDIYVPVGFWVADTFPSVIGGPTGPIGRPVADWPQADRAV
jgi:hypothetical protein